DEADWIHQIRDIRDKFDAEHDLGGLAIAKVWGLASNENWLVACATLHPGDLVEYLTPASEKAILIFASLDLIEGDSSGQQRPRIPWTLKQDPLARLWDTENLTDGDRIKLDTQNKRDTTDIIPTILCIISSVPTVSHDAVSRQIVWAVLQY